MKILIAGLLIAAGLTACPVLAQTVPAGYKALSVDMAVGFTSIRANAGPTDCGCFYMYGGSGQLMLKSSYGVGLLFDFGYTHAGDINGGSHNLSLSTYLAGLRYAHTFKRKFTPYGLATVGVAHSATNFALDRSTSTTAAAGGGGLDYKWSPRLHLRLIEAEYLFTQVPNGATNHQNQLRLTAGVVFHLK